MAEIELILTKPDGSQESVKLVDYEYPIETFHFRRGEPMSEAMLADPLNQKRLLDDYAARAWVHGRFVELVSVLSKTMAHKVW